MSGKLDNNFKDETLQKIPYFADICTMSTYEKIMNTIVAVFTVWFFVLCISQLSMFTNVNSVAVSGSGTFASFNSEERSASDNPASRDDLLARLSAAMKQVQVVPLSKVGILPKPTDSVVKVAESTESSNSSASVIDGLMNKTLKFHTYRKAARPSEEQLKLARPVRRGESSTEDEEISQSLPVESVEPPIEVAVVKPSIEVAVVKPSIEVANANSIIQVPSEQRDQVLEDIFVSRKGEVTRIDLQFSSDTEYSVNYDEAGNLFTVNLKGIPESNLKAGFPPLVVLSSVKYSKDSDGRGTNVALTLAPNVQPENISPISSGHSSRLRLSFVSKDVTLVSADGSTFIAAEQKWLGEGLQYMKYRYQPEQNTGSDVHILRYSLDSHEYGIGLELAQGTILGKARLSDMVKNSKHVAAVNASFFSGSGEPLGLLSSNRQVLSVPLSKRSCFGVFNGETALLGNPDFTGKVYTDNGEFVLEGINQTGSGAKNKMLVYTPEFGSSTKTTGSGLELAIADGRIVAVQENDTPVPPNGFVVGMRGEPAPEMSQPKFWDKAKFKWGLTPPWDVADFAIGGGPMLLEDGEDKITWKEEKFSKAFAETAAPRTAVGIGTTGDIFLVVADGRDKDRNRGLSLNELASVMRRAGCKSAINLDGGGSTTMWINGEVVNRPSDGRERKISSAIVLTRQNPSMFAASTMNNNLIRGI
jgi:hypothetical protein